MSTGIKVSIENKQNSVRVPSGIRMLVRRCCKAILFEEGLNIYENIDIVFTENRKLKLLDQSREQVKDGVLVKYPRANEAAHSDNLGEVHISLERALQQSQMYSNSFEAEVVYLTAHGILLLLGYNRSQRELLREKKVRIVQTLGLSYQIHV